MSSRQEEAVQAPHFVLQNLRKYLEQDQLDQLDPLDQLDQLDHFWLSFNRSKLQQHILLGIDFLSGSLTHWKQLHQAEAFQSTWQELMQN